MKRRQNALFAYMNSKSFQETDRRLLEEFCNLHSLEFKWCCRDLGKLAQTLPKVDLVVGWFASHHSFLPAVIGRLLKRKVVIFAADYDLADESWFGYGSMRAGNVRRPVVNAILRAADAVIVPSAFSRRLALKNTVLHKNPEKVHVLHHGFDEPPVGIAALKRRQLVTVGELNRSNWIRKGHREFIELGSRLPHLTCYLVGKPSSKRFLKQVQGMTSPNVARTGYLDDATLWSLFSRSQVYAQLSYMEGFGCSVAEAMLARCVPVVTRSGSLPEVVGDCGYYANYGDLDTACEMVEEACADENRGRLAQERVRTEFSMERRRQGLRAIVDSL